MVLFFSKNLYDFHRKVLSNFDKGNILWTVLDYQDAYSAKQKVLHAFRYSPPLYESPSEPVADLLSLVKPKKVTTSCLSGECLSAFWH